MIQMSILQPTQQAALGIGVELIHAIELILPTNTSRWNSQKALERMVAKCGASL
jgi:hypothetical protein